MQLREYMTSDCEQLARLPFFEKRGYRVKKEQTVVRNGISLTNFIMEK